MWSVPRRSTSIEDLSRQVSARSHNLARSLSTGASRNGRHRGRRPMLNRYAVLLVAGAAIFALDASAASAQDTTRTRPRSTKRIPITKEAPGEVSSSTSTAATATPRVDTVTVYKTDTLRLTKTDTVNVTKTETITKVDTVQQQIFPEMMKQIGGFYIGLAAGSSLPAAPFNDSDHPGWRVEVPIGIDPIGSPLGFRVNLGYSRYEPHTFAKQFVS